MFPGNIPAALPQFAGNLDIRALPELDHFRPYQSGQGRPFSVLASISLPSQSVPKIYSRQGAIFFLEKSVTLASSVLMLPHMQITARKTTEKPSPIRILCLRFHIFILPYPLSGSWDQ